MFKKSKLTKILALGTISAALLGGTYLANTVQPVKAASSFTILYIKHNAYEYNRYGRRANHDYIGKNSSYNCKGTRYISGRKYYRIKDGSHYYYVKATAVHRRTITKKVHIIHNAYVYNKNGYRLFSQGVRTPAYYFLFGTKYIDGNKYYEIGDGMYVKSSNVAHSSHSNNSSTEDNSSVDTQSNSESQSSKEDPALKPYRTVYVGFGQDDPLYQPLMQAINEWNATGAITFKVINNKDKANIEIRKENEPKSSWTGETLNLDDNDDKSTKEKLDNTYNSIIYFNTGNSEFDNSREEKITFEHELGHAIGLDHNHKQSIMNEDVDSSGLDTDDDLGTVQPVDVANVKKLFNEN